MGLRLMRREHLLPGDHAHEGWVRRQAPPKVPAKSDSSSSLTEWFSYGFASFRVLRSDSSSRRNCDGWIQLGCGNKNKHMDKGPTWFDGTEEGSVGIESTGPERSQVRSRSTMEAGSLNRELRMGTQCSGCAPRDQPGLNQPGRRKHRPECAAGWRRSLSKDG